MADPIDLKDLSEDSSSFEGKILGILENAINKLPPNEASADETASAIDGLYPADVKQAEDFLWALWTLLSNVAKKIPASDDRQKLLAWTVGKLRTKRDEEVEMWGQKTRVWTELPMLGPVMRDAWNLTPDYDGSDKDRQTIREWISINSFAARLYGAGLQNWVNLGIWELRPGLEEPLSDKPGDRATHLATACEWIEHAGERLRADGTQAQTLDEMEQRALKTGSLLEGSPGLSEKRWQFWQKRIAELSADAAPEDRARGEQAVAQMKKLDG